MQTYDLEIYLIPFAVIFVIYFLRRRKNEVAAVAELNESREAGLTEPPSLHPVISMSQCLGSGSCVKACPEGALGIIQGKAHLINPASCIGHGACMAACPHDAISLVFGTERRGMDIPQVDEFFETNIQGIFIAGELGGMGLVRKAVLQGVQAMKAISALENNGNPLDVAIIGAGPAGLAASLAAIENKLRYKVFEQEDALGGTVYHYPRNKIVMTAPIELPIVGEVRMHEISKEDLLAFWNGVIDQAGIKINFGERMENIARTDKGFIVKTTKGSYETRAVLLAIGRRGTPRMLGVPGENLPKVVYRLIDPEQYRNMHVLVVGGGDSALEAAIAVAEQPGTTVTLSYRSEAFGRGKPKNRDRLNQMEQAGRINVRLKSNVKLIEKDKAVINYNQQDIAIPNDAVIICAGGVLPTPLLKEMGVMVETKFGTA